MKENKKIYLDEESETVFEKNNGHYFGKKAGRQLFCSLETISEISDYLDYSFEEWPTISGQLESGSWWQFWQAAIDTGFLEIDDDEIIFKNEEAWNEEK